MSNVEFVSVSSRHQLSELLEAGEIHQGTIALVRDTRELWVRGTYISTADIKVYNGLDATQVGMALDAYQGTILSDAIKTLTRIIEAEVGFPDVVRTSHVVLTQDEYDARLDAGLILTDTIYYIVEDEEEE